MTVLFCGSSVLLLIHNRDLKNHNRALMLGGTEAWAVAMAAREELQRAQEGWHQTVADLKLARDEAIAANHARAMFVAGMSHELRTPLNAIIGFSEVLELELFGAVGSPRNREYVSDIRESGQHLLSMINDILDMSKIDAGKMALHEGIIDVVHMIASCCRIMRTRAADADVDLEVDVPQDQPLHIMADEVRLKQVLFNLLSNAVKFTPAGGKIRVSARESGQRDLVITVQDSGIGIAAEHMALVFEPFRQVDDSLGRRAGGTGLGLALSKALITIHGGDLQLASTVGEGTIVTVTLPNLISQLVPAKGPQLNEGPERVLSWLTEN
ncbi:histidine kinase [Skermanella aerolata KACC 11604]|nr:histidine kinase [Skermanella aerolata KACC 11604]